MLFLIIHPESDYEMFRDTMKYSMERLERNIIEADNADDAICKYAEDNEGQLNSKSIENYFALQVASKKCEVISSNIVGKLITKEN